MTRRSRVIARAAMRNVVRLKLKQELEQITQRLNLLAQAEAAAGNQAGAALIFDKAARLANGDMRSITGAFIYANGELIEFDRPGDIEPRMIGKILEWLLPQHATMLKLFLGF